VAAVGAAAVLAAPGSSISIKAVGNPSSSSGDHASSSSSRAGESCGQTLRTSCEQQPDAEEGGAVDWEEAFASDNEVEADKGAHPAEGSKGSALHSKVSPGSSSSSSSDVDKLTWASIPGQEAASVSLKKPQSSRLKHLRVLVWPDVPAAAVELVQQRCPRVLINPTMKCNPVTGRFPPIELDGSRALDEPYLQLVGPEALLVGPGLKNCQ
jgi:hypothetical protein